MTMYDIIWTRIIPMEPHMELLTVRETAQMLRVSPLTIRRYIADGRLSAIKAGKGIRVRKESVEQFVIPVKPKEEPRMGSPVRGTPTSADDPLWNIVGIAESEGRGDVAEHVDNYLAEAYFPRAR